MLLVENGAALHFVKLQDIPRRQSKPESDRNDAAGGGADDQIEIGADGLPNPVFQLSQKGGRKDAADAASIQRQHLVDPRAFRRLTGHVTTLPYGNRIPPRRAHAGSVPLPPAL